MSEHETEPNTNANAGVRELLPYATAAVLLGVSPDAVRMRCTRGVLVCETVDGGRRVVWPQPEQRTEHEQRRVRTAPRSVRSGVDGPAAADLRLAEVMRDRDRWRDAHADLSRQHEIALQLVAAANASLELERDRAAVLENRLARVSAIGPGTPADAGAPAGPRDEISLETSTADAGPHRHDSLLTRLRSHLRRGSRVPGVGRHRET